MEDHSQAISFANSYFSLVDGLAPGLEDHLDENVVLDWFGRTIRGRKNVTEFMKSHNVGSRHVFNTISPVAGVDYKKSQSKNRKPSSPKTDNYVSSLLKRELNFDKLSIADPGLDPENNNVLLSKGEEDDSSGIFESEVCRGEEISVMCNEPGENDLSNLFALEITPKRENCIDGKNVRGIKNDGEKSNRFIRKEEEEEEEKVDSNCTMKYVEANGHVVFSKKSNKRGTEVQTWRRQSKLEIAYSLISSDFVNCSSNDLVHDEDEFTKMDTDEVVVVSETRAETPGYKYTILPSLVEITEMSNSLIPNINNFGGYFPSLDFAVERDNFLLNLNAELTFKNSAASLRTPQYVDNRLIFTGMNNKPRMTCEGDIDKHVGNRFVFNYLIHFIIYQGSSRCRRSLTVEFEGSNKKNI